MNKNRNVNRATGPLCAVCAALSVMPLTAHAVPSVKIGTAALISPASSVFPSGTTHSASEFAGTPKEIVELARALRNNPDLIYDYVRNNVETVWMYGLQKGAVGAIIDKSGTPLDQAQLMVRVLKQAGYPSAAYQVERSRSAVRNSRIGPASRARRRRVSCSRAAGYLGPSTARPTLPIARRSPDR